MEIFKAIFPDTGQPKFNRSNNDNIPFMGNARRAGMGIKKGYLRGNLS
jgi:hypothetical protein